MLDPLTIPSGNPVTDMPGFSPKSPFTTLEPVFVTVEAASTAKPAAVPKPGAVAAKARVTGIPTRVTISSNETRLALVVIEIFILWGKFRDCPALQ